MSVHHDILWAQESPFQHLEGEYITLEWFYENDSISWTVLQASYDHIHLRIQGWNFSWVVVKVDVNILWWWRPKVRRIKHWKKVIDLYSENDQKSVRFAVLTPESEVKKLVLEYIGHFENGFMTIDEVIGELKKMGLDIEMIKLIKSVNQVVTGIIISQMQDAS